MVLRIHVLREGGHAYYVDDLVPGRAEGTLVAGEEPGLWWGAGAASMDQRGRVAGEPFAELLAGRDPASGLPLRVVRGGRSVSAYDLTFCAPKSVSLVHLLAPGEMANETGAAHRAAVDEALGYLERSGVGVRRAGSGRVTRLPATGLVAAAFLHRTSRALDPHLHTHVVAANVAQGADGRWSALDSRRMFVHAPATQAVYHARLRLELGERLGGACEVAASGLGDLVGVDRRLLRLFSQRAAAMDEYRHRRGGGRGGLGRPSTVAFHVTRPEKDRNRTVDSLRTEWRVRAATFGFDLGDLTAVVGRRREVPDGAALVDRTRAGVALEGLARAGRSLARRDLVAVVASASTRGASAGQIESVAEGLIKTIGGPGPARGSDGATPSRPGPSRDGPTEPRWRAEDVARALDLLDEEDPAAGWRGPWAGPADRGIVRTVGPCRGTWPSSRDQTPPAPSLPQAEWQLGR